MAQTKDFLNAFLKNDIGNLRTEENGIFFLMINMLHSDKFHIEKKTTNEFPKTIPNTAKMKYFEMV